MVYPYIIISVGNTNQTYSSMKGATTMASQAKKNKAKNSYLHNGNEAQKVKKMKRIAYYIKADRKATKAVVS